MATIFRTTLPSILFTAALLAGGLAGQTPEYAPERGTPVIQGDNERDGSIYVYREDEVIGSWKKPGVTNVHMLHTADPKEADREALAGILRAAQGVWFVGGRRHADSG